MKTTVSEKGQVTIPKPLRDQLGLSTGTVLDFTSENGRLTASKLLQEDPYGKWRGRGRLPMGKNTMDYLKAIRDDNSR